MIKSKLLDLYALLFAKKVFARLNRLLFMAGARGLGILNYKTPYLDGEEHFVRSFLSSYDNASWIVLDVGANEGQFASLVLSNSRNVKIRSYEPSPLACRRLTSRLAGDALRHELVEMGVSNSESDSVIYDYGAGAEGSQHASLYREVLTDIHGSNSVSSQNIRLTTLDSDLSDLGKRIAILKIDVEGHEKAVLEGAQKILATNPPLAIVVEFNEMNAVSGTHYRDFASLIGPGYNPYRLLPGGSLLPLSSQPSLYTEIYAYQNLVFLWKAR